MRIQGSHGFTMIECLMGLALFGVIVAVMIPGLSSLDRLLQTGRQMGRKAASVPLQETLIANGYNPASSGLTSVASLAEVRGSAPSLAKSVWENNAGSCEVWLIQGGTGVGTSQVVQSFGFQLGQGTDRAARGQLVPAAPPVVLSAPTVSPTGPDIAVASFAIPPSVVGQPWSIQIVVTAADPSNIIKMRFLGPTAHSASGVGSATFNVSAADVLAGGTLQFWSEYAGTAADTPQLLSDGRTRWWTSTNVFEPSLMIARVYRVSVGSPSLFINGTEFPSGSTVPVNWDLRTSISSAYVGYDPATLTKLGSAMIISVFSAQFNAATVGAPDVSGVFNDSMLPSWGGSNLLTAQPLALPSGMDATAGSWTLNQSAIALGDPDLVTPSYNGNFVTGGTEAFEAPFRGATRVGRVKSGNSSSLGPELDITVNSD